MRELHDVTDNEQWFKEYKEIIAKHSEYVDAPETIYDCFSEDELNLLFRVVQAEVGDEYSFDDKANVASVIFNRLEHEEFGDDLFSILTKKQFSCISDGRYRRITVSETTILACEYAYEIGDTTDGCLYFESGNSKIHSKYAEYIMQDSAHKFYR